ncbi:DUF4249 domain-containing protein [Niastella caeni]|uniref:DUF4249 domain-containing protein n=1 Tax=Niastella caeni TaxID=2569763 RepID=A0A4S8I4G8_9BACT|nr:DUF4249 domain-containing protein [Niastella caeni]THU41492.1 DUF4249 domain-containing protein [Niastella caeni]
MRKIAYCCVMILLLCCKEKYDAPVHVPITGYLVIEGYISANGPAEIHLSRSIPLADSALLINETGSKMQLQGRDNSIYDFVNNGGGMYSINQLNLNSSQQYRLNIKTREGKEYASDYVKVRTAPSIDSVGWIRENGDDVQIYINTHDPRNDTWYYRWTTEETWEYHSDYYTSLDFNRTSDGRIRGVKWRRPDMQRETSLYTCWQGENSTNLILGSSAKLSKDSIHKPLISIPFGSWKLSVLYSLYVKQYALSKEEYQFLEKMKRNSEETGSVFGRQPSELKGNVRCLTNPSEPVVGFIGIANRQEKRIWIKRTDLPDWQYVMSCETYIVPLKPIDSSEYYSYLMPVAPFEWGSGGMISYLGVTPSCVDCTIRGTNRKPTFWP